MTRVLRFVLAGWIALGSAPAMATDVTWDPGWTRFHPVEAASTGLLLAGAVTYSALAPHPTERWAGGILVDDPIRNALVSRSAKGRAVAAKTSDVLLWTLVAWPLVEAGAVAIGSTDDQGAGGQMALIGAQSLALSLFANRTVSNMAGRQRPYQRGCASDDAYVPGCNSPDSNRSFFSGHTAMAVTGAALVCVQHGQLGLYGEDWACPVAATGAVTVGVLRIVADRHYLSDVVVGATVGIASGLILPRLLHYRRPRGPQEPAARQVPMLTFRRQW